MKKAAPFGLSAVKMQKLVLKGKQDAKKVKELRQEIEDAKQEAHDAEKKLKSLLDAGEPPKDAEPGEKETDEAGRVQRWVEKCMRQREAEGLPHIEADASR